MNVLVLGGSVFVGRHLVEQALLAGHDITVMHRGNSPIPANWKVEELLADRDSGIDLLNHGEWDAVVDTCGYVPRIVEKSANILRERVGRYLFISTISVYTETEDGKLVVNQNAPIAGEEVTAETYGPLKVECEEKVNNIFGSRATIVRPGLIAGPFDPTNRFPYWVDRFDRFREVLVPKMPGAPLQQIDARDLANFCLKLLDDHVGGTFDACGVSGTLGDMVRILEDQSEGIATFVDPEWLTDRGVKLGADLPLAFTSGPGSRDAQMRIEPTASIAAGLKRRPFEETAADTLAWTQELGGVIPSTSRVRRPGLDRDQEEKLLVEWATLATAR